MPRSIGIGLGVNFGGGVPAFSPLDLSPVAWYDASNTSSITESGGSVSQINDLSGNGYHLTQATGANQPSTGTATINGRNVLVFSGSNDFMSNTSIPSSSRPHTYVIVAKETSGITVTKSLLNPTTYTSTQEMALYLSGTSPSRKVNVYANAAPLAGPTVTASNVTFYYLRVDGASSELTANSSTTSLNIGGTTRGAGLRVGADGSGTQEFFNGQIAEIMYLNKSLTAQEFSDLQTYLNNKWGL
jgi:hypothetical protein